MKYDFDRVTERRSTNSLKWNKYEADVLPLWVADMDFIVAEPITRALQDKIAHGIFGYEDVPPALLSAVCARMNRLYGWQVLPEHIVVVPGIVTGINIAARAVCGHSEGVLIQPPIYPPFIDVSPRHSLGQQMAELTLVRDGATFHYEIDFDKFEAAITPETRMFLLSQPHNPIGKIYSRDELTRLAEICQRHNLTICSDEIHSELLLGGAHITPMATLSPEIAARTITFVAASKTFNLAGLFTSFAIIPDPDLRQKFIAARDRHAPGTNSMGYVAAQAAFNEGDEWLGQLRDYLTENRSTLVAYLAEHLPEIRTTVPDATYLAWLDCRDLVDNGTISGPVNKFFLERARVAFSDGVPFGPGGTGFVRLNFGCTRATLVSALDRMSQAIEAQKKTLRV